MKHNLVNNNSPGKTSFFFLLLLLYVRCEFTGGTDSERDGANFEEKPEYTNRVRAIHSKRLFKRILSNPKNSLIPYGSSFGDKIMPYGDDISFGPIKLKDDLILNDKYFNGVFISTNGFISFERSKSFEPIDMSLIENPEIAVLFNDFDTKKSGSIYYKEVVDTIALDLISSALESKFNSTQNGISLTSALVVTWVNVPTYSTENKNTQNTFQLVLATEANCSSYSIFLYEKIDFGSMTNFSIGITSGEDGLFLKQVDQVEFLNLTNNTDNLPLKYSFRLSDSEVNCMRNDTYKIFPFGLANGDVKLPRGDDISYGPIYLNKAVNIFAKNFSSFYISTNGYISFEPNEMFESVPMSSIDKPIIAVFFNDFDSKKKGNVFYRETQNKRILESISSEINATLNEKPELTSAVIVTWDQIPTYGIENVPTRNRFQLVLATTENCSTYSIFLYDQIDLGSMTNFSIGITSGNDGLFLKQVTRFEFLNSTQNLTSLPFKQSFRLGEGSCKKTEFYDIYPYGLSNGDEKLPRGDDISFGPISLNKDYSFYGQNYSSIYISTNGFVSFEFNEMFEPVPMSSIDKPTIAVLFDDFDTKRSGNVFYRQSENKNLLESISNDINNSPIKEKPELTSSMIITWDQVPTYGIENIDTKNTFQLVLGSGDDEYLYGILIYQNVSLGTQTNFTIGFTDGDQSYYEVDKDAFLASQIEKLIFNINTASSSTESSTTVRTTTIETSPALGTSIATNSVPGTTFATDPVPGTSTSNIPTPGTSAALTTAYTCKYLNLN